jgi:hypothetical protein
MSEARDLFKVYKRDNPGEEPYGWIQWKGTDVCMDLYCKCGFQGHVDTDFFYHAFCPSCDRKFFVGCNIKLIELTPEEVATADKQSYKFKSINDLGLDDD